MVIFKLKMFITNIIDSANSNSVENINRRIKWSEQNTWSQRFNELEKLSSDHIHSIIVLAYGDSNITSKCVKAIIDNCDRDRTELIIIDNGSTDNLREYLKTTFINNSHIHYYYIELNFLLFQYII